MSNEDQKHEDLCRVALSICVDKIKDKYPSFKLTDGDKQVIFRFMVINNIYSLLVNSSIPVKEDKIEVLLTTEDSLVKAVLTLPLVGKGVSITVGPNINDQDTKEIKASSKLVADVISGAINKWANFKCSINATMTLEHLMFMHCIDSIKLGIESSGLIMTMISADRTEDISEPKITMTLTSNDEDIVLVSFLDDGEIEKIVHLFQPNQEEENDDDSSFSRFKDTE